jgi:beta-phosphoglucomutase-like phosphatase (HAD superfamily)
VTSATLVDVPSTQPWCAGRFWWDWSRPSDVDVYPLRAVILDLDAVTDLDCEGHRVAFNAAFAAHGLPIGWSEPRYRQLLALRTERQRVLAELRKRCVGTECDVLTELLADEICAAKQRLFEETVLDAGLSPRPGLLDFVMDAFTKGVPVAVMAQGPRRWAEPLVRQLVGDGLITTIVTADDATPGVAAFDLALDEVGASPRGALAIAGCMTGARTATTAGIATVLVGADDLGADIAGVVALRPDYSGTDPLRIATCERLHSRWAARRTPAAA